MKETLCLTGAHPVDESFVAATLKAIRRCPARADFIEICFVTSEGSWTWCFREPSERTGCSPGRAIALTIGSYGAQARSVDDGDIGLALPTSEALPMILGHSPTYVDRRLVHRGW